MLKRTPLKIKNTNGLKRSPLKQGTKKLAVKKKIKISSTASKAKWAAIREECLERDGRKCQVCGRTANEVHHIHLRSDRADLKYSINNLISLCCEHHFHMGTEKYIEQTKLIAHSKNMTVEELLAFAES